MSRCLPSLCQHYDQLSDEQKQHVRDAVEKLHEEISKALLTSTETADAHARGLKGEGSFEERLRLHEDETEDERVIYVRAVHEQTLNLICHVLANIQVACNSTYVFSVAQFTLIADRVFHAQEKAIREGIEAAFARAEDVMIDHAAKTNSKGN